MRLRLEVPATSANLGPGYDSFGLALNIVDTLTLTVHDAPVDPATCVEVAGEGAEVLPRDRSHLIMRIIGEVLAAEFPGAETGLAERLSLHCINRIRIRAGSAPRPSGSAAAAFRSGTVLLACSSIPSKSPRRSHRSGIR